MLNRIFNHISPALCRKAAGGAAGLVAPPRCHGCGKPMWGCDRPHLCGSCIAATEWIDAACVLCGYPSGVWQEGCGHCPDNGSSSGALRAVARYGNGARSLVRAFKFGGEQSLAPAMAGLMAQRLLDHPLPRGIDCVAPVSLHPARLRERGFDQAALLAGTVAELAGLAFAPGLVRRVRRTRPQALLGREERVGSMHGVFETAGECRGKTILLVDDVYTTGATMNACALACRLAGAAEVYGLVFAR